MRGNYQNAALVATILLGFECFQCFGLFFQPSWAKGWPGIPQEVALRIGFSGMAFLMTLTAIAIGVPVYASIIEKCPVQKRVTAKAIAFVLAFLVGAGVASMVFWILSL